MSSPTISLAPPLKGLAFRYPSSDADYAGMAAVRAGSAEHDDIDPRSAREEIPTEADLRGAFDGAAIIDNPDLLLVTMHGQIIGYNQVLWRWTEVTGVRVYLHLGYLLPAWRGKGIGTAMLHWAQARIRAIAADEHADEQATFATNVSSTEREADALMRNAGYRDVRRMTDMQIILEPPVVVRPFPTGIETRTVFPEHYRAIYRVMKLAIETLPTSTPESDADYQEFLDEYVEQPSFDPALWRVAWSGDQVVGIVLNSVSGEVGHMDQVEVHPTWQRQGIGRSLLQSSFAAFADRGISEVRLFTDAADGLGARSFYESLGFCEVKQHIFYRKLLTDRE